MTTYARVNEGLVQEIVLPLLDDNGVEFPISERYTADFVAQMVDITNVSHSPESGWSYEDGAFSQPVVSQPTAEEIQACNTSQRDALLAVATQAMTPLLVSLQLGDATDAETASAKAWQAYCRDLKAVDLAAASPAWPTAPAN